MGSRSWLRHSKWTKFHRWVALFIGLQMVLWVAGGLVFVWSDIDNVHGDFEAQENERPVLDRSMLDGTAGKAIAALSKKLGRPVESRRLLLSHLLKRPVYAVYEKGGVPAGLVDARTLEVLTPLKEDTVRVLARADYKHDHAISSIELLEETPSDYRGSEKPVWRVAFNNPKETRLYISRNSGRVLARRNWNWRLFDFFWMLHTMDYWGRDDFNHWLIRGTSLLAALVSLSGVLLLFQRFIRPSV